MYLVSLCNLSLEIYPPTHKTQPVTAKCNLIKPTLKSEHKLTLLDGVQLMRSWGLQLATTPLTRKLKSSRNNEQLNLTKNLS